ncbi:MAG: helix-turn-helix transcriptional regulator, partial [Lacrimispora sphenoides]
MDTKLELLTQIASGIATHFGNNCEVVIHDIRKEDIESSIVYIENGQVSNRKLGDGPSEIVLETLKKNPDLLKDRLSYLTRTDDGRILKSSTMYIRGKNNTIDYILALNYDITGLLTIDNSLKSLLSTSETGDDEKQPKRITHNVNDLLDALIEQSVALVGKP